MIIHYTHILLTTAGRPRRVDHRHEEERVHVRLQVGQPEGDGLAADWLPTIL